MPQYVEAKEAPLNKCKLIFDCEAFTTELWIAPGNKRSIFQAAKAPAVAWTWCTPLSWSWTLELSPP